MFVVFLAPPFFLAPRPAQYFVVAVLRIRLNFEVVLAKVAPHSELVYHRAVVFAYLWKILSFLKYKIQFFIRTLSFVYLLIMITENCKLKQLVFKPGCNILQLMWVVFVKTWIENWINQQNVLRKNTSVWKIYQTCIGRRMLVRNSSYTTY